MVAGVAVSAMTRLLVGVDDERTGSVLCRYLGERVTEDDTVYAVNSLPGGNDDEVVEAGTRALELVEDRLGGLATVETEQFARGNDPTADIFTAADEHGADEIVVGIDQKRTPVKKILFGSVTQAILLHSNRPVVVVPLPDEE